MDFLPKLVISRREFSSISTFAILDLLLLGGCKDKSTTNWPTLSVSSIDAELLGCADSYALRNNISQTELTISSLGVLYARIRENNTLLDDPAQHKNVIQNIKQELSNERKFYANDFSHIPQMMAGGSDPAFFDPKNTTKGIGIGLSVLGAVAGTVNFPGALALTLMGILAEPTLTYLATPGLDLARSPFPPTPPADINQIAQWSLARSAEAVSDLPPYQVTINIPEARRILGLPEDATPEKVVNRLPPEVKSAIAEAMENGFNQVQGDIQATQEAVDSMGQMISDGLHKLEQQGVVIQRLQQEELSATERAAELALAKAELEYTNREIGGAIQIGAAFVEHVLGNPTAARTFQASMGAIRQVYHATGLFYLKEMGTWALAGSFVSAADILINAFGSSQEQQLLEALRLIDQKLTAMAEQLQRLELQQIAIYEGLKNMYAAMQTNAAEARTRLVGLQQSIDILYQDTMANFRAEDEIALGAQIDACQSHLRTPIVQYGDQAWIEAYRNDLTIFYTHAVRVSKKPSFTGNTERQLDLAAVAGLARTTPRVDLIFAMLPKLGAFVDTVIPTGEAVSTGAQLPNPIEWARGANAYLEARALAINVVVPDDPIRVPQLWNEGLRIREAARVAGSYRAVRNACKAFKQAAGIDSDLSESELAQSPSIIGLIYQAAQRFENEQLTPRYVVRQSNHKTPQGGEILYSSGNWNSTYPIFVENDPVDSAIQLGLLKREGGVFDQNPTRKSSRYRLIILQGPDAGKPLLQASLEEHVINADNQRGVYRVWNPPKQQGDARNPQELIAAAFRLNRTVHDIKTVKQSIVGDIEHLLKASHPNAFEGGGAIAQIFATIAQWRRAENGDERMFALLANNPGIITIPAIAHVLHNYVVNELKPGETYALPITLHIRERFRSDVERFLGQAEILEQDKGIAVVDSTLKRLAGFMRMQEISFSMPTQSTT